MDTLQQQIITLVKIAGASVAEIRAFYKERGYTKKELDSVLTKIKKSIKFA